MSEPTFEEMRPLLQPLAAIVAMHALIGLVHTNGEESAEQRVMTRAIDYADTLMAGLNANAISAEEAPAAPPVARTHESTEDIHFPKLLDLLDRVSKSDGCDATLRAEAARIIQEYDDDCIPF